MSVADSALTWMEAHRFQFSTLQACNLSVYLKDAHVRACAFLRRKRKGREQNSDVFGAHIESESGRNSSEEVRAVQGETERGPEPGEGLESVMGVAVRHLRKLN